MLRIRWSNKTGVQGLPNDHRGLRGIVRIDPETIAQGRVGHPLTTFVLQRGMLIASADAFFGRHFGKTARREEHDPDRFPLSSKIRRGKLMELNCSQNFVDAGALFLTEAHPPHQRCQRLIARSGRGIKEPIWADQRSTRIGDLHPITEKLYKGASASDRHVLMDQRIGDQFSNGNGRIKGTFFPESRTDVLVAR